MLKITRHDDTRGRTTLHLEGRLTLHETAALEQACADSRNSNHATAGAERARMLALDLSGVSFADRSGAELLHRLRLADIELLRATPFVNELLRDLDQDASTPGPQD
jgi:anti-anti-sigma regulatory factor